MLRRCRTRCCSQVTDTTALQPPPPPQDAEFHWSIDMAARLLEEQARCAVSSSGGGSSQWCRWIDSLPRDMLTPVSFSQEAAFACQVQATAEDMLDMQRCLAESYEVRVQAHCWLSACGTGSTWGSCSVPLCGCVAAACASQLLLAAAQRCTSWRLEWACPVSLHGVSPARLRAPE
jgi:hypothetical protein